MSEAGDGSDIYNLYAVVVHIDMLNASFFGHYICYIKDFRGNWYRIDDSKVDLSQWNFLLFFFLVAAYFLAFKLLVSSFVWHYISKVACVELEEVLSQGAYMLLYKRYPSLKIFFGLHVEPLANVIYSVF